MTNPYSATVSVINTSTNTVSSTITTRFGTQFVSITPNGSEAYVTYWSGNTISVINTSTNSLPPVCIDNTSGSCTTQSGCAVGNYCNYSGVCAAGAGDTGACSADVQCDYGYYCNHSGVCASGAGNPVLVPLIVLATTDTIATMTAFTTITVRVPNPQ